MRSQKQACNTDPAGILGCLPGTPTYGVANGGGIGDALMDSISGISDGSQLFLGLAAALEYHPENAGLLANTAMFGDGSALFVRPFLTDNNPDDRRKVNMDYDPTYFAEEEMFQLQLTHEEGDLTYSWSTGYTETMFRSTEDYEKGVTTGSWQPGLDALVDLGNATALSLAQYAQYQQVAAASGGALPAIPDGLLPFMVDFAGPGTAIWAGNSALLGGYGAGIPVLMPDGTLVRTGRQFGADQSMSDNEGWSHEFRVQSNYDGNLNFMIGAFNLDYEGRNHYVVVMRASRCRDRSCYRPRVFPAPSNFSDPHSENNRTWGYENDTRLYELDAQALFGIYYDVNQDLRLTLVPVT